MRSFVLLPLLVAALPPQFKSCQGRVPTPVPPTQGCHRGGCSGQLCTDAPDVASTCEWREEYACFQAAECTRQADGQCGFTPTPALTACLAGDAGTAVDAGTAGCFRGGCSNQLCTETPGAISTCEWREEYACYQAATCERQRNGQCGFTPTPELVACLGAGTPVDAGSGACFRAGCSGQLCSEDPNLVTTCEWLPEYACYRDAACERQADGRCGFTPTPELSTCLSRDGGN